LKPETRNPRPKTRNPRTETRNSKPEVRNSKLQRHEPGWVPGASGAGTTCPKPETRNPTPCTPHPTPYILHPAPCTPHPTPYTLHPTSCTLHLTPCTPHPHRRFKGKDLVGSLGPLEQERLACLRREGNLYPSSHQPSERDQIIFLRSQFFTGARPDSTARGTNQGD
jgi:hypothetical protein